MVQVGMFLYIPEQVCLFLLCPAYAIQRLMEGGGQLLKLDIC
jgi:hypothetical protein